MRQNLDQDVSIAACRPKIAGRRLPTAEDKARKRALWPREVRNRGKGIFSRPLALRYGGKTYRLEIRSSKGRGFWIMVDALEKRRCPTTLMIDGGPVVYGTTEPIALANVIKTIDTTVEVVRDTHARVLA